MKQNKYDEPSFFSAYEKMARSVDGLDGAGEWPVLQSLLPNVRSKDILDLGCGFGWHCRYAIEQQAKSVIGVDISEKMLDKAREKNNHPAITYLHMPIEEIEFTEAQFDVVISSLAFHYIEPYSSVCQKIHRYLKPDGDLIFSVEHPIFTSRDEQDWHVDQEGNRLHWPVDNYQLEGVRHTAFLTKNVLKYHRTISTYLNELVKVGFVIKAVKEPEQQKEMIEKDPSSADENRRPMFLIVAAKKI